ncbi:unnamed protein product [Tilletia controversa]|uniref:Deacetylase sirtuin-type domain-containing protein n=1 Tax=Tilletia controversa TaxID=13291 RepID=A0A8X7MYW5_9BASI|nr:hypothetical protein CF328_g1057 [Tilletia controversa]KAE8253907.1 hypothetical protein A4X06_0g1162 [Tilletia controversa]CAD6905248.1 unnamed protein product [Tilletia controversa]CAD6911854.1 unnamed protein product [Tilletia controversa]CAD6947791.1 unnamed protein product [Tilletia controversa]
MSGSHSQLTVASTSTAASGSSQASSFVLENYQEDCDSDYLDALEAIAYQEAADGAHETYVLDLMDEAERLYPKDVLARIIQDLKQIGLVKFVQTYILQRRADVKVLLVALQVGLPRALLSPEVEDVRLIPVLKSALSRILRKRSRLSKYNTPDDVVRLLRNARKVIVLSGAGISVSVGIPDFRSKDGIYAQLQREGKYHLDDPTDMFDKRFFQQDPTCFYDFVHSLWPSEFTPSPTHYFIKLLEERGQLLRDYTQNIDTLEHQAGITRVLPCHGSFATASCTEAGCNYRCKGDDDDEDSGNNSPSELARGNYENKADSKFPPKIISAAGTSAGGNKKGKKKRKRGWGPGESEEDNAEDEVWVQGGRAGVGLSTTHAPTEVLGLPKLASASSSKTDSPKRPLRRSASGRLVETPLQAGAGQAQGNWKGVIKPDVVFFGEKLPDDFDNLLVQDRDEVDLLLVMGTSLKVAPVSELVSHIPHSTPVVLINRTPVTHVAMDVQLLGDADEIIGWLCRRLGWELPGPHRVQARAAGSGHGVVPASQPDVMVSRMLSNDDFEPRRAGTSPIWLWPTAEGGKAVQYLEMGAKLDEFGRVRWDGTGSDDDSDEEEYDDADEDGDQDQEANPYLEPLGSSYGPPMTPDIRYLPPGVVGDSQASSSPALSYASASRLGLSPTLALLPALHEEIPPSSSEQTAHASYGTSNGQNTISSTSNLASEPSGGRQIESVATLGSESQSAAQSVTEMTLQMRTDSAVGKALDQVATDRPVQDRTLLCDAPIGVGSSAGVESAGRRAREIDGLLEDDRDVLSTAKRAKYEA